MAQDQQLRENRILDAARRRFIHYGYNKTSVAEIAQEAGVSKGAVYLHFSSKDDLLHRLLRREMMRYAEDRHQRIEADPEGGTIGGIYRHILAAMKANSFIHAVMAHDRRVLGTELNQSLADTVKLRADFVRQMQERGVVKGDADPDAVAYLMSSLVVGITTMDELVSEENVPTFDSLLSTFGKMADAYLSTGTPTDSELGKEIIRNTMDRVRRGFSRASGDYDGPPEHSH